MDLNPYAPPSLEAPTLEFDLRSLPPGGIPFRGSLTVEEAMEADRLTSPNAAMQQRTPAIVGLIGVVMLSTYVINEFAFIFGPLLLLVAIVLWFQQLHFRHKARTLNRQRFGTYQETEGYFAPHEIRSRTETIASVIRWDAFRGYKMSPRLVILYLANEAGILIAPRSKFASDEHWEQLRALVAGRLPPV